LCDADEESSSDMLSEELDTDYDDEINLEIEGGTASEGLSNETSESERAKKVLLCVGGWKDVTMGDDAYGGNDATE
jgi:hypothetical protein